MNTIRTALLLLGLALGSAASAASQPLDRASFGRILSSHAGQPLIVHIWGITCGPCVAELPRWGALRREHPDAHLVLIQADASPPGVAEQRLARAGLAGTESWTASDEPDEYVRASIDPQWAGDMPRTLLVAADGHVERIQGTADFAQVRRWLATHRGATNAGAAGPGASKSAGDAERRPRRTTP